MCVPNFHIGSMVISFLIPLIIVFFTCPDFINKLTERGFVVKDYHKKNLTLVPTYGGFLILLVFFFTASLPLMLFNLSIQSYIFMLVILSFGLFGLIDDMINIGKVAKICIMYYCSYPLMQYINPNAIISPSIGNIDFGLVYLQFIVPTYILVASNLINMHAGFNGLDSGLSIIILISLILKSMLLTNVEDIIVIISFTGALVGYFAYERYPSKIFLGNVGSLSIGAAIGITIVTQGFLISGFIILIPHTINFLMYIYWKLKRFPDIEFAKVRHDGTLEVPNRLTLKWFLPYYYNMNEKQATYLMYLFTGFCCLISFLIPW